MHRLTVFLARLAILAGVGVVVTPSTAAAHGLAGVTPTNYESRVFAEQPEVEGIEVRAVDLGDRLELRNRTDDEVLVLGYQEEPYLRIGPDGVFENRASPSWEANRDADADVPSGQSGADQEPRWVRIGSGDTVSWHDHRAHWMRNEDPPAVRDDPNREHSVQSFEVLLEHDGRRIVVPGEVVWVPGPSPWPWLAGAAGIVIALVALSRTRFWPRVFAGSLVVLIAFAIAHVVGAWSATSSATSTQLAASVYSIAGIVVGAGALVWIVRARDPYDATPLTLVSALFLAVAGGLADLTTLTRSQLPTTLPPTIARVAVVVALGLGTGLAAGAALRIRRPQTTPVPAA